MVILRYKFPLFFHINSGTKKRTRTEQYKFAFQELISSVIGVFKASWDTKPFS